MSIASRIQEMETHIGNAYASIDNLGIDISNTNKNIYNISALLDTFYDSLPKVSGIGTSLSLSPTMVGKIKLNEIQGDTLQDGTPTPDTPVEIQSVTGLQKVNLYGKNLLKNTNVNSGDNNYWSDYSTYDQATGTLTRSTTATLENFIIHRYNLKNNTKYTISCDIKHNGYVNGAEIFVYNATASKIYSKVIPITTNFVRQSFTFTTDSSTDFTNAIIRFDNNGSTQSGTTATLTIKNVMLVEGTNTDFEKYNCNTYEINLGKNLFNQNYNGVNNGITYTFQGSKITLDGTTSGEGNIVFDSSKYITLHAGKYTFSSRILNGDFELNTKDTAIYFRKKSDNSNLFIITGQINYNNTTVITLNEQTDINIQVYTNGSGMTLNNLEIGIQIEKGSVATSYSPYFTPIKLNKIGDYQDSIKKSTGKNLFDKDNANIINAYFNVNGVISNNDTRSFYIPCKPNTTYTIQKNGSARFRIGTTETIPENGVSVANYVANDNDTPITITTSSTTKYIICYFYATFDTNTKTLEQVLDSIMINEGSTALPYEPYGKVWYIEKNTRKLQANISDLGGPDNYPTFVNLPFLKDDYPNLNNPTFNTTYKTNIAPQNTGIGINTAYGNSSLILNKAYFGLIKTQWLEQYPNLTFTIEYGLSTPTYTEITNTELINQLETLYTAKSQEGTTNISITSEDLEMILNVSALKGEE